MKNDESHPEDPPASLQPDYHVPVLLNEAVEGLRIEPSGTYVDCTFGAGGHSRAILKELGANGRLIVFDQDEDARKNQPADDRVIFIPQNFRHLQRFLKLHKVGQVDGLLADLGVSSHQFDEAERGFSTRFDANLDMRMDRRQQATAEDILAKYTESELQKIFEKYGEVTNAKTLARTIAQQRITARIKTISQFRQAVQQVVKGNPNKYFAQVFQALRIEVNDEMGALKDMLSQSLEILKPGGRMVIISFHSLEDRIVKNFFKDGGVEQATEDEIFGHRAQSPFTILTRKPLTATKEEVMKNPRSRSAKLRIAEKK